MCVCVCVCARSCACVCVCMYVCVHVWKVGNVLVKSEVEFETADLNSIPASNDSVNDFTVKLNVYWIVKI